MAGEEILSVTGWQIIMEWFGFRSEGLFSSTSFLLHFFYYNEEPTALFLFSYCVVCFLQFCCIWSKRIWKDYLDRWWYWLWVVIHMQALSRTAFVPYVLSYMFPLEIILSAGANKISKYVIFLPLWLY